MNNHYNGSHDHQPHQHPGGQDHHRVLDLDAEVFGDNVATVLDMAGLCRDRGEPR
jgi:hypothetical protein